MYGADFSYPYRDYAESGRACVEAWVTLCLVNNVTVELCPSTSLIDMVKDEGVYGYAEQPDVLLPDGRVFKYVRKAALGRYAPEDSSGKGIIVPHSGNGLDHAGVSP